MTKIVLTHTGSAVPDYTELCIRQIKHTNPNVDLELIADYKHGTDFIDNKVPDIDIALVPIEQLEGDSLVQEFRRVSWYKAWGRPNTVYPSPDNFVQGTSERLFLLAAYLQQNNMEDVWHFENDNLIYGDIPHVQSYLDKTKLTCCYMNEKHTVWNVLYVPKAQQLYSAMEWYANQLSKGNDWICKTYGLEMAHEMTVMSQYKNLSFFPSMTNEPMVDDHYFDPASYGQFIGGTNNGHPPGFRDEVNHDIGKSYTKTWTGVIFDKEFKKAYILNTRGDWLPLFNLHMHNKTKMKDFISYE